MAEEHSLDDTLAANEQVPSIPVSHHKAWSNGRRNVLLMVIGLVAVVAGFFLWRYLGSYESTDDAQVDAHLYPVSARVSGYVVKVDVGDNQEVQKGAVLVEID